MSAPLLIEWSTSRVRVLDPVTDASTYGATLAECAPPSGREAVIAVGRRSAFVRTAFVPSGAGSATEGAIAFQMAQALPLAPHEIVFGYRLGESVPGKGRRATVGAVRAETLTRIDGDARASGLKVRAVLPLAFGSWLAARAAGLRDAAVVGMEDGVLSVDLVRDGELVYSRAVPTDDVDDEIERTFAIAEAPALPVLALGDPQLPASRHETKEALAYLADLAALDRLLFNLEPPARRVAREARHERWKAQRALLSALGAVALGAYAAGTRARFAKTVAKPTGVVADAARMSRQRTETQNRLDRAERANRVLDVAFRPPQTIGDVVQALAGAASGDAWLTGLTVARGAPLAVSGLALHGADVSKCLALVAGDKRFQEMRVVATNKGLVGTTPVVQFALQGRAVGTLPYDRPLKPEKKKERKAVAKARPNDQ